MFYITHTLSREEKQGLSPPLCHEELVRRMSCVARGMGRNKRLN